MALYMLNLEDDILNIGFDEPSTNDKIVSFVADTLKDMKLSGGPLLKITGSASLPVAFAISHAVGHLYGAVAVFDPKLQGYVVALSHNPEYPVGLIIR